MSYQSEFRLQCWRAIALCNGSEALLHVGGSSDQVRSGYVSAFHELLDADERDSVRQIVLQCWAGAADQGRWTTKGILPVPSPKSLAPSQILLRSRLKNQQDQSDEECSLFGSKFFGAA